MDDEKITKEMAIDRRFNRLMKLVNASTIRLYEQQKAPKTRSWEAVLAGVKRAQERVASWPKWKQELGNPVPTTPAEELGDE